MPSCWCETHPESKNDSWHRWRIVSAHYWEKSRPSRLFRQLFFTVKGDQCRLKALANPSCRHDER